jgi:hypothetical protein
MSESTKITIESRDPNVLSFFFDLQNLSSQIEEVRDHTSRLLRIIFKTEKEQSADLVALTEKIAAGTALDESIKTLVQGIADELETNEDPKVQVLANKLREQTEALSSAVQENIPNS